ncbi:MAG: HesA/MoeB/ThiF family protein [Leptospira sp.]|nr:HesA/MoeB/ThiF family protein [Leptospira sp.]
MLSSEEISRYSRNILLNEVGRKGQEKLKSSTITVIGAGGLGSPALFYLAAAGIGEIRIVDSDTLDITNLQRQIVHTTESINAEKTGSAITTLKKLNPHVQFKAYQERLNSDNINSILENSSLVMEGSDNFETKFLVNDACYFMKIPLIIGGILRFEGQVIGIRPDTDACYRCTFNSPPPPESVPSCADAGVIGSVAGIIGSIQATEAIKYLIGLEETGLFGKILTLDAKTMNFRNISTRKNTDCPLCGNNKNIFEPRDEEIGRIC